MKLKLQVLISVLLFTLLQCQEADEGKIEQAKDILELTQNMVGEASEAIKKITDAVGKTSEVFTKFSKFISQLGPIFMCVSAVLSISSLFVPKAESEMLSVIKEGFEQVNDKVDSIVDAIEELKIIAELSSAKISIIPNLDIIKSLTQELRIARYLNTPQAWEYFKKRFQNEFNHATSKFYYSVIGPKDNGDFRLDFLDLFRKKMNCVPKSIAKLCITAMQTINKGLDIEAAFFGVIKYTSRIKILRIVWDRRQEKLRARCLAMIERCEKHSMKYASKMFEAYYQSVMPAMENKDFSKSAYALIGNAFPHLRWAIWTTDEMTVGHEFLYFDIPPEYQHYKIQNKKKITILLSVDSKHRCSQDPDVAFHTIKKQITTDFRCYVHNPGPYFYKYIASRHSTDCRKITSAACFAGVSLANQALVGSRARERNLGSGHCIPEEQYLSVFC